MIAKSYNLDHFPVNKVSPEKKRGAGDLCLPAPCFNLYTEPLLNGSIRLALKLAIVLAKMGGRILHSRLYAGLSLPCIHQKPYGLAHVVYRSEGYEIPFPPSRGSRRVSLR